MKGSGTGSRHTVRIGVVGTGFISRHFRFAIDRHPGFSIARVLTRRRIDGCSDYPDRGLLTNSLDELLDNADVVFESSGDAVHATDVVEAAVERGLPVATLNSEFHVTAGSAFVGRGLISEAEGDQPGCQAALREDVMAQGFEPLAYVNMKAFQKHDPTPEDMRYWSQRSGLSLPMTVSATDGTKLQIEQALVANGFGANIARPGLVGPQTADLQEAADILAAEADAVGEPISDYMLAAGNPHGVFIVARSDPRQQACLQHLKMGTGPNYVLQRLYILAHLDVMKTIRRLLEHGSVLLDNSAQPRIGVAAIAKRQLDAGTPIAQGIGSFEVRGNAVRIAEAPGHVPIGLLNDAVVRRPVAAGETLTRDDVDLPDSRALQAWLKIEARVCAAPAAVVL